MPKTASALLVVPYQKFPTNKPSPTNHLKKPGSLRPLSFPCPESDESLASNASASFLASTEDTLSSLLSNSLTRIRVDAIESFYYSKWMLSLLLWNSSFLLSLISLITIEYSFLTLCLCSLCSSSTWFSLYKVWSFKFQAPEVGMLQPIYCCRSFLIGLSYWVSRHSVQGSMLFYY